MNSSKQFRSIAGAMLAFALAFSSFGIMGATAQLSVIVCHGTASQSNPYIKNVVSVNSVAVAAGLHGHGAHSTDIWAPYVYEGVQYPGQGNWDLLDSSCNLIEPTATPTALPPTPTSTALPPTPTNTAEPTPTLPIPSPTPTATDIKPTPDVTPHDATPSPSPTSTVEPTPTDPIPSPTATATIPPSTPTEPSPTSTPADPSATPTLKPPVEIPSTGAQGQNQNAALAAGPSMDRLAIPALEYDVLVGFAERNVTGWELDSRLPQSLEGTQAIAIHAGYKSSPQLATLRGGELVLWRDDLYLVMTVAVVDPSAVGALALGDLSLVTCAGYDGERWTLRLVITANQLVNLQ